MNRYLLDTNVFIQAKNLQYGMDFCPAFWEWLVKRKQKSQVRSIKAVYEELTRHSDPGSEDEDELASWARSKGSDLFLPHDQELANELPIIAAWCSSQKYIAPAIADFFSGADAYIVAFALAHNYTVVTLETASDSKKKLKIPDACRGLGVQCINTYEMLRIEAVRFVLQITTEDYLNSNSQK